MKTANQIKGDNYEAFVLDKLKSEYEDIWLWKNVPERILYKCGVIKDYAIFCKYRNLGDLGIDIVAVKDDVPYFIQCKNFSDTITLDFLAGFYFFLYENDLKTGILCYSGKLSRRVIDLSERITIRNIPYKNEQLIIKQIPTVIVPKEYQIEACKFLKGKHRSILSLPCGMGKTYCACMIAEKHDDIIIISPLRELAKQNLESFSSYFNHEYHSVLISVDGERDRTKIELGKKNIISLTYDSVDVLNKMICELKNMIIVIDEFHNISENSINGNTEMTKILKSDKKILFLSATPKHTEYKKIFGEHVFSYDWSKAIANKYINDFDIVLPSKEQSIETFDKLLKSINSEYEHNKMACKMYFLLKCILYNGDKKIIVFFATHEKMNEGIKIIGWLSKIFNIEINVDKIDCNTSCKNRTRIINIFAEIGGISILCCVRVLNEGMNISRCDAVFVTQPNDNLLNLVQRMSRCIRITEDKKKSHVYIWCKDAKKVKLLEYLSSSSDCFNKKTSIVPMDDCVIIDKVDDKVDGKINGKANGKVDSNVDCKVDCTVDGKANGKVDNKLIVDKVVTEQVEHKMIIITENGIKIYVCELCNAKLYYKPNYYRHKKSSCPVKLEQEKNKITLAQEEMKQDYEKIKPELKLAIEKLDDQKKIIDKQKDKIDKQKDKIDKQKVKLDKQTKIIISFLMTHRKNAQTLSTRENKLYDYLLNCDNESELDQYIEDTILNYIKKEKSDSSSDSDQDEKPKKITKKKPIKKSDDTSDDEKPKKITKKKPNKKVNSSSDSETEKPNKIIKKKPSKKVDSSSESESEKPKKIIKKKPNKKSDSDQDEKPRKIIKRKK